jgi:hypothetical protein
MVMGMGALRSTVDAPRANGMLRARPGTDLVLHEPDSSRLRPVRRLDVRSVS